MPLQSPGLLIYPITSATTTPQTTPEILRLLQAAVDAEIPLFQVREKSLPVRALYELTSRAAEIARGSKTRLLVNDRADLARASQADGVHLTSSSLPAQVVRGIYGPEFLIGVSTHSLREAEEARKDGADFVVFGPVFETESKREFGEPQGLQKLREVTHALDEFPVLAIGGITLENVAACFAAGARGVAAIRLFSDPETMTSTVNTIRSRFAR